MIEQAAPELAEQAGLPEKKLTNEKLDALRAFHQQRLERLSAFWQIPSEPSEFVARRQDVFKLLN